jgi:hypothetical protein
MRVRDALELGFLSVLYAVTAVLAYVFESEQAKRAWLPVAGFSALFLFAVSLPCQHARVTAHRDQIEYHLAYQVRRALDARIESEGRPNPGLFLAQQRIRLDLFPEKGPAR